jgi:hypothetical protein
MLKAIAAGLNARRQSVSVQQYICGAHRLCAAVPQCLCAQELLVTCSLVLPPTKPGAGPSAFVAGCSCNLVFTTSAVCRQKHGGMNGTAAGMNGAVQAYCCLTTGARHQHSTNKQQHALLPMGFVTVVPHATPVPLTATSLNSLLLLSCCSSCHCCCCCPAASTLLGISRAKNASNAPCSATLLQLKSSALRADKHYGDTR